MAKRKVVETSVMNEALSTTAKGRPGTKSGVTPCTRRGLCEASGFESGRFILASAKEGAAISLNLYRGGYSTPLEGKKRGLAEAGACRSSMEVLADQWIHPLVRLAKAVLEKGAALAKAEKALEKNKNKEGKTAMDMAILADESARFELAEFMNL